MGYTAETLEAVLNAAKSSQTAHAERTAAVEYSVGLLSRCFASAIVEPDILNRTTLTPSMRAAMIRRLLLRGNAVYDIRTNGLGNIVLAPAFTHDIRGGIDPARWVYRMTIPTPSSSVTLRRMAPGVVHVGIEADPATPWLGCSPLLNAGLTTTMLAQIEHRSGQEASARVGHLLPMPDGAGDDTIAALKADLAMLAGGVALVETTSGGMGQGRTAAPQADWELQRFGAEFPEGNTTMRREVGANVCSAVGVPSPLYLGADGTTMREAYRQLLVSTIQPLAAIISQELEDKLGIDIRWNFRRLQAADIAARARAYGTLIGADVAAGITPDVARAELISGLRD